MERERKGGRIRGGGGDGGEVREDGRKGWKGGGADREDGEVEREKEGRGCMERREGGELEDCWVRMRKIELKQDKKERMESRNNVVVRGLGRRKWRKRRR